jgi:hypothetical protein
MGTIPERGFQSTKTGPDLRNVRHDLTLLSSRLPMEREQLKSLTSFEKNPGPGSRAKKLGTRSGRIVGRLIRIRHQRIATNCGRLAHFARGRGAKSDRVNATLLDRIL